MASKKSKILIGLLSIIGVLAIVLAALFFYFNESEPDSCSQEARAEQWADEILTAVNKEAWDTLAYISWDFANRNQYAWDRKNNVGIIEAGETKVVMQLDRQEGKAFRNNELLEGEESQKAMDAAWANWCNDSFWLSAHYKIKDQGTTRCISKLEDGREGLMVTYTGGGTTPGDKYLWLMDENNRPNAYKMWVKIIPVGGMEASWTDWTTLEGGAMIAQTHMLKSMNVSINDIKSGQTWDALGYSEDPFQYK